MCYATSLTKSKKEIEETFKRDFAVPLEYQKHYHLNGFGSGMLLSVLSIAFFNSSNAEKFPLGGFLPALWLVSDLGGSSQLVEGGLLMMGGMLGYYLILAMWRGRPKSLSGIIPESSTHEPAPERVEESNEGKVIQGKSLADFL